MSLVIHITVTKRNLCDDRNNYIITTFKRFSSFCKGNKEKKSKNAPEPYITRTQAGKKRRSTLVAAVMLTCRLNFTLCTHSVGVSMAPNSTRRMKGNGERKMGGNQENER